MAFFSFEKVVLVDF